FLKSWAITPVANTHAPAFMPWANLTLPAPSSTGSRGSAFFSAICLHLLAATRSETAPVQSGMARPAWRYRLSHCRGSFGRCAPACVVQCCWGSTGANDDDTIPAWHGSDRRAADACGSRAGAGLSESHHHDGGAVSAGRTDRRAGARVCSDAAAE